LYYCKLYIGVYFIKAVFGNPFCFKHVVLAYVFEGCDVSLCMLNSRPNCNFLDLATILVAVPFGGKHNGAYTYNLIG
jgi:hypothetical protein